jgi:hypothetical protein
MTAAALGAYLVFEDEAGFAMRALSSYDENSLLLCSDLRRASQKVMGSFSRVPSPSARRPGNPSGSTSSTRTNR